MRAAAGIDVGGTFAKIGVVSADGALLREHKIPTEASAGPAAFVRRLSDLLGSWRRDGQRFSAAGLAIAGDVDSERGTLRLSPNLPGWNGYPLRAKLSARLAVPVAMDNDATLAVWGAYRTELKAKPRSVVGATLGTGVGGGLVLDGRLFRGATGSAGELGHMKVAFPGEPCHCGETGCLEAYAGAYGIVRQARRLLADRPRDGRILRAFCPDLKRLEPAHLSAAARRGDALSREVWARTGSYLGTGLSNLVLVLNPDVLLILGGVSRAKAWLAGPIRERLRANPFRTPFSAAKLKFADNPNAGRIGAALLALEERAAARA